MREGQGRDTQGRRWDTGIGKQSGRGSPCRLPESDLPSTQAWRPSSVLPSSPTDARLSRVRQREAVLPGGYRSVRSQAAQGAGGRTYLELLGTAYLPHENLILLSLLAGV